MPFEVLSASGDIELTSLSAETDDDTDVCALAFTFTAATAGPFANRIVVGALQTGEQLPVEPRTTVVEPTADNDRFVRRSG